MPRQLGLGGRAHLDFGCYDGAFLNSLVAKGIRRLVGVDISAEAVAKAHRELPHLHVLRIASTYALPVIPYGGGSSMVGGASPQGDR